MADPKHVNEEGFQRRLDAVQLILQQYGLKSSQVTPLAYVAHCPFHFNNFIYKVDLSAPATPTTFAAVRPQPCTTPPPSAGISVLVVRMSNPHAEGLNNANRVQNEVAATHLARAALAAAGLPALAPAVYAWAPCRWPAIAGEPGFGWTVAEFKAGVDLDGVFPALALEEARDVLGQLAAAVAAVQRAAVPATVAHFGALTGGPWDSYAELWVAKLKNQLANAAESSLLKGWEENGVRERVLGFLESGGVDRLLGPVDTDLKILTHGDLTLNNLLYDVETKRITALLDFDWAAITHPCDEFLSGLWDVGGGIHERVGKLQPNVLSGNFSVQPDNLSEDEARKWEVAKAWDAALERNGGIRPSSIVGVDRIQALRDLEELLAPFELVSEVMLKRISDEDKTKRKGEKEATIVRWLEKYAEP